MQYTAEDFTAVALVAVDTLYDLVGPVDAIAEEFDPELQAIESIEPLYGWAPYTHAVNARDHEHGEVRRYMVRIED